MNLDKEVMESIESLRSKFGWNFMNLPRPSRTLDQHFNRPCPWIF